MKRFALAGNPNCGKTTLFNALTGSTAHVGNWPGVTVDKKEGVYKKGKEHVEIIDLPGIYSLSPYTDEEIISRNYILEEKPDCIINIVDATNLERNLYLTTQLMEIDVPMIIALNMCDVIEKNNDSIDEKALSKELGLPVVKISALKNDNLSSLMDEAISTSEKERKGTTILESLELNKVINECKEAFEKKNVSNPLFHAVKLVELDEVEVKNHQDYVSIVNSYKETYNDETFGNDFEAIIADARYKYISAHFSNCVTKHEEEKNEDGSKKLTLSDKIDRVLTNKWAGIPIFLVILFLVFHFTFSENLFWAGSNIESNSFEGSIFEGLIWHEGGINSLGVILQSLVTNFTDWLSSLAADGLANISAPNWVQGFLVDGCLAGVFSVLSFVPQILLLFLFFSIMEDTGYMARVAFILDRIFRKFGLSGRSFIPMIMGFGCSVPAMINTRTLADDKEKIATVRVIPFFSCGAKLPILTAIAGGIAEYFGFQQVDLITYSMYLVGMITAIVAVIVMRKTELSGDVPPFIMELPAYHLPQFKSLMIHLWDKLKHFIKKAFTIILFSTIIIWFLSSFQCNWQMCPELVNEAGDFVCYDISKSILASIGQLVQPLFTPLGFGSQLGTYGWVFAVAAVTGLIAKENVIATFGVLAATIFAVSNATGGLVPDEIAAIIDDESGVSAVVNMIQCTHISWAGLISFIVFNMTTIPCFAAVATAKGELTKKSFKKTIFFWLGVSYLTATIIFLFLLPMAQGGTYWWSEIIVVLLIACIFGYVYFYNHKDLLKKFKKVA
jgi:ferrous iron transport protein B